MRAWWVVVMAVAACEGRASSDGTGRRSESVTAEDISDLLDRIEDLERARDELRTRLDAVEAQSGITPGDLAWPARGTVLADVSCSDPTLPLDEEGRHRPGIRADPLGPLIGRWSLKEDGTWRLELFTDTRERFLHCGVENDFTDRQHHIYVVY